MPQPKKARLCAFFEGFFLECEPLFRPRPPRGKESDFYGRSLRRTVALKTILQHTTP